MGSRALTALMLAALTLAALILAPAASADGSVSRWVDGEGRTHFGDTAIAPVTAQLVNIGPANHMDVPSSHGSASSSAGQGPTWTLISRPAKRNKKGWRPRRESLYTGRKHSSGRRR